MSGEADNLPEYFGRDDPREMPDWFFGGMGSEGVQLHYETAVRADVARQNYSVAPRHWYVDATMRCEACGETFAFSAAEQRRWYEDLRFYVESIPKRCPRCRREQRRLKGLRQEYDRDIARALAAGDRALTARLIAVIDALCEACEPLPDKVHENRKRLAQQIGTLHD